MRDVINAAVQLDAMARAEHRVLVHAGNCRTLNERGHGAAKVALFDGCRGADGKPPHPRLLTPRHTSRAVIGINLCDR